MTVTVLALSSATTVGYSHNAFAGSGSQTLVGTTNINVDSFGVQQFFAQKAGKQQIVMGNNDPNVIPGFGLDGGSKATPQTLGQFHYYTIKPRSGGLASGGTQLTMRINLNPVGSSGTQVNWMTAEKQGYMVTPNDIDEFEQTGYFRLQSVTKDDDITLKQGGQHTSSNPSLAGAFGIEVSYSGNYGKTAEKELNHPKYEFFNDPVSLKTGSIVGKWIGVKEISRHTPNGQLYDVYVDLDPIDFATGLPKNNWQHLSSHLDDGKESGMYAGHITSWGKKYFTYRIDNAPNIDFALLSVHHIDTATGQTIPTCSPPVSGDWIITSSCTRSTSVTAPANVIVQNNSILTILNGVSLNIHFKTNHLIIKSGSGVLIKAGGKIT